MDPATLLALFGPVAVELGKGLIGRFVAPEVFKPSNVDDWLKMRDSDVALFKAMNDAGGAQGGYPWVDAVVRLMRPGIALMVLGAWVYQTTVLPGGASPAVTNFAAAIGFYLFGDRTLFYARQGQGQASAR